MNAINREAFKLPQLEVAEPPWVLLWSQSQCALHIEPVSAMLRSNRRAYREDRRMDYVPIFIGPDEACRTVADAVRETMTKRQRERN